MKYSVTIGNKQTNIIVNDNTIWKHCPHHHSLNEDGKLTKSELKELIINLATKKLYGKNATFVENYSMKGYGQVFKETKDCLSNITNQISISIEKVSK